MFLKPPLDSVPNFIRPSCCCGCTLYSRLYVPLRKVPFVKAADLAIGDRHVLGRPCKAQGVGALQADPVVERGVDRRVRDPNMPAGVDVDAVAVGVDLQVVDRKVVDAGREDRKVAAVQDRKSRIITLRRA